MESEENELTRTKAALLRVEREMEKLREEISEMRGDIHSGECRALGFKPSTFMAMSYSAALTWVANVLSPEMMKKMEKYPHFFEFRSDLLLVEQNASASKLVPNSIVVRSASTCGTFIQDQRKMELQAIERSCDYTAVRSAWKLSTPWQVTAL